MTQNNPTDLLRRILGEEAEGFIQMMSAAQSDQALLQSHGIDPDAMLQRAQVQIIRSEKIVAQGINPPIALEDLTDEQFEALDTQTLTKYLAASDINTETLLARVQTLIDKATPKVTWQSRIQTMLPRWQSAPVLGMAVSAIALVAVGIGVLQIAPQDAPLAPAQPVVALTKAAFSPVAVPEPNSENTNLLTAEVAPTLKAAEPPPFIQQAPASALSSTVDSPASLVSTAAPVMNSNAETISETIPPLARVDINRALAKPQWALTSAPDESASEHKIEFIFKPGDTLSHGMAQSGLPAELWAALAERVGSNFHPGDKAIIYFENDEFEQLVVIRRKKERTTVTADLKTNTVAVGTTTTIEVAGEIQTSLYVALEEKLNADVAQRISWLLEGRDVPLTTLPKGSTFRVRIEQISGADGETLRYGQISRVQLDAGGKGQFVVEGLKGVNT